MDLIFFLEWINFWIKLENFNKNLFFIIYFNLIILLFISYEFRYNYNKNNINLNKSKDNNN